jgi:hypothetical protein
MAHEWLPFFIINVSTETEDVYNFGRVKVKHSQPPSRSSWINSSDLRPVNETTDFSCCYVLETMQRSEHSEDVLIMNLD